MEIIIYTRLCLGSWCRQGAIMYTWYRVDSGHKEHGRRAPFGEG